MWSILNLKANFPLAVELIQWLIHLPTFFLEVCITQRSARLRLNPLFVTSKYRQLQLSINKSAHDRMDCSCWAFPILGFISFHSRSVHQETERFTHSRHKIILKIIILSTAGALNIPETRSVRVRTKRFVCFCPVSTHAPGTAVNNNLVLFRAGAASDYEKERPWSTMEHIWSLAQEIIAKGSLMHVSF